MLLLPWWNSLFLGGTVELILPLPQTLSGLPFPLQCPWHKRELFCRMPPDPSKRGEHIPGYKPALSSCNLRSPPCCLTRSLLCASCVKHQDIPQELLIYFANSALLCGSQTSNGLWSSSISELNSRSFKNLLYYMKDLTLSTCWVFGSRKADLLQIEFVKLRHPGPGWLMLLWNWGQGKKCSENSGLWASKEDLIQWMCFCCPLLLLSLISFVSGKFNYSSFLFLWLRRGSLPKLQPFITSTAVRRNWRNKSCHLPNKQAKVKPKETPLSYKPNPFLSPCPVPAVFYFPSVIFPSLKFLLGFWGWGWIYFVQ